MTAWLPFLSLRSHREVVAAKDETIAFQRDTIRQLTDSLEAFRETMRTVREAAAAPRVRTRPEREETRRPVDYSAIDPADNSALAELALDELGPGRHSAIQVSRRIDHIRRRLIQDRAAKNRQALEPLPPSVATQEDAEALINQAIAEGTAAAEVN